MAAQPKPPQAGLLLVGETFSPWTKKARWALEHCGLSYDYQEYIPTLSEPALRWRLRQFTGGPVTVPVLFVVEDENGDDGTTTTTTTTTTVLRDSWEIARYASQRAANADGRSLFGEDDDDEATIRVWNDRSEAALAEGRTAVLRRALRPGHGRALEEALPPWIPRWLRRPLRFVARCAAQRLDRKYAHLVRQPGALRGALLRTREALAQQPAADDGNRYLLGRRFSYADIAMAVVLEVIAPIAHHAPPLGPAVQRCWNDLELAGEFADLLRWRDRLATTESITYSQFRPPEQQQQQQRSSASGRLPAALLLLQKYTKGVAVIVAVPFHQNIHIYMLFYLLGVLASDMAFDLPLLLGGGDDDDDESIIWQQQQQHAAIAYYSRRIPSWNAVLWIPVAVAVATIGVMLHVLQRRTLWSQVAALLGAIGATLYVVLEQQQQQQQRADTITIPTALAGEQDDDAQVLKGALLPLARQHAVLLALVIVLVPLLHVDSLQAARALSSGKKAD